MLEILIGFFLIVVARSWSRTRSGWAQGATMNDRPPMAGEPRVGDLAVFACVIVGLVWLVIDGLIGMIP